MSEMAKITCLTRFPSLTHVFTPLRPLPPPFAAPDTTRGSQLHPQNLPGKAEVSGGSGGVPATLGAHQQPPEKDPP